MGVMDILAWEKAIKEALASQLDISLSIDEVRVLSGVFTRHFEIPVTVLIRLLRCF